MRPSVVTSRATMSSPTTHGRLVIAPSAAIVIAIAAVHLLAGGLRTALEEPR